MIKDYLRSVRKLKLDIEAKKRERDTLYMTLTGTTIRPKEVDVQTSVGGDVFGDRMAIVADYDRELDIPLEQLAGHMAHTEAKKHFY